jgi:hypothetical protein
VSAPDAATADRTPDLLRAVELLSAQVDRLTRRLDDAEQWAQAAAAAAGIAVDALDQRAVRDREAGAPADERLDAAARLLARVTSRQTLAALDRLADRLPLIEQALELLAAAPDFAAMLLDAGDEQVRRWSDEGLSLEAALRRGLHTALWLSARVSEVELDRLGTLLRSDILDPHTLQVISHAATALVQCQQAACRGEPPQQAGMWAGVQALRDPDTQRSLAFLIRFSQQFGRLTGAACAESPLAPPPRTGNRS